MNQYIINRGSVASIDFSGASIYLDACFILTFLDIEDRRNEAVANMLDKWRNDGNVTIGYSSHTYSEVVQTIFRGLVLGSLQIYHQHKELLNKTIKGYDNRHDYLATLDGDFEHNYYSKMSDMFVKILKVA